MDILVTGGAGFIGSNLIKSLVKKYPNSNIISVDNYFTGKKDNHIDSPNITYLDISVTEYLDGGVRVIPEIVYHFGEYSRIVKSFDDIDYLIETNLYSTSKLIEKCKQWGSKIIYSASSSKFGNEGKDENLSPYAWVKAKMVELIKNYGIWYGLNYEIVYFYNVYGYGQIEYGDYATVIGIFERQYRNGEELTVVSPGTQERDFTHIKDIVEGTILTTYQNLNHEWYLRSGQPKTIIEVANLFGEWTMVDKRRGERQTADIVKNDTQQLLGWVPKNTIEDYILTIKNTL
jgi:UDP-glucose 4-epimerase|tara:strand:- start:703 stop:1569 length:867 start_codon:yes stop_codon:yes gene_type:complete